MQNNKVRITTNISSEIIRSFKTMGVIHNISVGDLISTALKEYIESDNLNISKEEDLIIKNTKIKHKTTINIYENININIAKISKELNIPLQKIIETSCIRYLSNKNIIMDTLDDNKIIKFEWNLNLDILSLYKETFKLNTQTDKEVLENIFQNENIKLKNDYKLIDNNIRTNHGVCIYSSDKKLKETKIEAINNNVEYNNFLNHYLLQKIIEKGVYINIDEYKRFKEYKFNFPQEILDYELTAEQKEIIDVSLKNNPIKMSLFDGNINNIFYNIYKMIHIFKYSMKEINMCICEGSLKRMVEMWLAKLGWNMTKEESQQRSVNRGIKDYTKIRASSKKTQLKNSQKGSVPEEYARHLLNHGLTLALPNYEVIVGLNNLSILTDGKEIDIPIIIIDNNNNFYKFAIEYGSHYWHNELRQKDDEVKKDMIKAKNYHIFYILTEKHFTQKQLNEYVEKEVSEIIKTICELVINNNDKNK